ncbi:Hypothetical protein R9X50_00652900 [Acrodontium crateriforme]|uniref:Zn(2)-C6 fungal-type domain-containing protein n=1 Tax=Acrodontium crateriforme TaxID=150365 RepID=A0AAQ3RBL7_9PEZI|nr:Hypothetical protein R9X50_00652900 [Acrodontium crateriforme]
MDGLTRRNGDRAACEPCRKSKQRCDHGHPPCGRCARRGFSASQCYYHPYPMAQAQRKAAVRQTSRATSTASPPVTTVESPSLEQTPDLDRATGLIGMQGSLSAFEGPDDLAFKRRYTVLTSSGVTLASVHDPIDASMLGECTVVLEYLLKTYVQHGQLVRARLSTTDFDNWTGNEIILRAACFAVDEAMRRLQSEPSHDKFTAMALMLFHNTKQELRLPTSSANGAFEAALSGENLRWETIGLYASELCRLLAESSELTSEKKSMTHALYSTAVKCEQICEKLGQINDLILWLLIQEFCLATWCFGDDSYHAWRASGKVASTLSALNYHQGFQNNHSGSIYLTELRRRAVALAHEMDKQTAMFVGRPPQISRHYSSIDLPLDIDDAVLLGPYEEFVKAKAALDENGWRTDKRFSFPSSRLRATLLIALLREEALELLLSRTSPSHPEKARSVVDKLETMWRTTPFSTFDLLSRDGLHSEDIVITRWMQIEYLYTKFLLLKLLANQSEHDHKAFIIVSHEILQIVLSLLKSRNALMTQRPDLEFTMVTYAMPTASVLLLELNRLTRQPHQTAILPRSTIIKAISALITCCDWFTESGQGNFALCKRAQAIFSRGLDEILDETGPRSSSMGLAGRDAVQVQSYNGMSLEQESEGFVDDPDWTAWLQAFGLNGVTHLDGWNNLDASV